MKRLFLLSFLVLGACASPVEKSVVIQTTDAPKISVNKISPPSKLRASSFQFQSPSDKSSVVALDETNLKKFRLFLLTVSEREEDWKNRLGVANENIRTLTDKTKSIQAE